MIEQFRRAGTGRTGRTGAAGRTDPARRGWVPDVVVITLTVGGLVQIVGTGTLSGSGRQDAVSLLVPGLLAISVALVAARTLPPARRMLYGHGRSRRIGSIGVFLAVRQVARRPGGVRTTVTLATAFTLVVFAVAAWSTARTNHRAVADTEVGAPVTLTITPPASGSLASLVEAVDPGGHTAAGVSLTRPAERDAPVLVGVDPARFADVTYWRPDFAAASLPSLLARLHSRAAAPAPPVRLTGDEMRVRVAVRTLTVNGAKPRDRILGLRALLTLPGQLEPVELSLGSLPPAGESASVVVRLPGCAAGCELRLVRFRYGTTGTPPLFDGHIVIRSVEERSAGAAWRPVAAGLFEPGRWRPKENPSGHGNSSAQLLMDRTGLEVRFHVEAGTFLGFEPASYPSRLPAITTARLAPRPLLASGVDALDFPIDQVGAARALPAAVGNGLLVDQEQALRAGGGTLNRTEFQIWVRSPAAVAGIRARVRAAGVRVLAERRATDVARDLGRRGPGLALILMLVDAAVVTALAVAGVMLSLHASARRRTYELAALQVAGVRRTTLRAGLLVEQAIVLGHGLLTGVATGLIVVWLALPTVPQFVHLPASPPLHYAPDPVLLGAAITAAFALVATGGWLSTRSIMRRTGAEQLREAPP